MWRMWERDTEWSAPTIARHIHGSSVPLETTFTWRYDILWDWLLDACHMARVIWGTCCEGFCSKKCPHYCFEQSVRNPLERDQVQRALGKLSRSCLMTSNKQPWFTSLEIPWGFLARAALRWLSGGLCHARKCQLEILCEKKRYDLRLPNGRSHQKPSVKGGKGKENLCWVYYQVSLSILLWETHTFCARNMGAHVRRTTLKCQRYKKPGGEIGFPCSRERREEISK